jgi:hypothetical protein
VRQRFGFDPVTRSRRPVLNDHLLKRLALELIVGTVLCCWITRARIERGKEQEKWKDKTGKR